MDQGNGLSELEHTRGISDGTWHNLTITFNSDLLELIVDGNSEIKKPTKGPQKHIDLTDR